MKTGKPGKRGKPFEPGNNLGKGRPTGSRNKITLAVEELLEGDAEAITRKASELARKGDSTALRLCMDRIYPMRREPRLRLDLPRIDSEADIQRAHQIILEAVGQGRITTEQAERVVNMLEGIRRSFDAPEAMKRLADLESAVKELETELKAVKGLYEPRAA